jgi:hypothetical protein
MASITASSRADAVEPEGPRLDEYTAYTIEDGQFKLGALAFEYGLTDRLSIGTDPPMWAARAVVSVFIPNLHTKYTFLDRDRVRLTGQIGVYYADFTQVDESSGGVLMVPLTLWTSVPLAPKWTVHFEGAFNFTNAVGTGSVSRADLEGSVTTRSIQVGAMGEYRLKPKIALTARARFQPWMSPFRIDGNTTIDPYTRADIQAELTPKHEHPMALVASATFLWKHVHLTVGGGYGAIFLPGSNLVLRSEGFVPDASLSFLF